VSGTHDLVGVRILLGNALGAREGLRELPSTASVIVSLSGAPAIALAAAEA
jgi:hypothetical protein